MFKTTVTHYSVILIDCFRYSDISAVDINSYIMFKL